MIEKIAEDDFKRNGIKGHSISELILIHKINEIIEHINKFSEKVNDEKITDNFISDPDVM